MGKIIGIDLGTTNSAVAIYNDIKEAAEIYDNRATGQRTTPSVIALKTIAAKNGVPEHTEWLVGSPARNQAAVNPFNTFYGVKRLIGRKFNDPEVAKMQGMASYQIVEGPKKNAAESGDAWVMVGGKATSPQEISAKVLMQIKKQVEEAIGEEVTDAVITVPAYFDDTQRQATIDAGAIAGLNVKRIINEPTAAALAYGMGKTQDSKIAVFDLGGGTFDVSILDIQHVDGENLIQVISNNGDTFLGGENFDERITERLLEVLKDDSGLDINLKDAESKKKNAVALQKVRMAAERAKIALSQNDSYTIEEQFLGMDAEGNIINLNYEMSRKELNSLLSDLVKATLEPCKKALADAGMTAADLDKIILVGGQTKMPLVIDTVREFFGKEPSREVNPDEIVAMGASVQGAILTGKIDNVLLRDVIPLSIGIATKGDVMKVLVPRNSPLPFTNKTDPNNECFTTSEDMQKNVNVQIYQGERAKSSDNKLLGKLVLDLPPMKQGVPQIRIDLEIDANGVMNVTATETTKNIKISATLQTNSGLTDADIQRMQADAEKHKAEDDAFRELTTIVTAATYDLKEAKDEEKTEYFIAAPDALKAEFAEAFKDLTEARDAGDIARITEKKEALSKVRMAIGEAFSNAADASSTANDNSVTPPAEDGPKTAAPGGPSV